jgi:hypothetical protein
MRKLPTQLRALGVSVNALTHHSVNYGGCGVYAALVCERLEALGITAECIVPDWGDAPSVDQARDNLGGNTEANDRDWVEAGLSFYHVGVRFEFEGKWYTHDSDRTRKSHDVFGREGLIALDGGMTAAEMRVAAITDGRGWNPQFSREYIPEIEQRVAAMVAL